MCLPVAAAGAGAVGGAASWGTLASIAGTAVSFYGQQQSARSQDAFSRQRQRLGTAGILENFKMQTGQVYNRMMQDREAAANEISNVARESERAQATASVSAGEAGVTGKSVDALLDDFERQELMYQTNVKRDLEFSEGNLTDQLESMRLGAQGRIEQLQFMPAQRPSFLGAALRIGGSIASYYASLPNTTLGSSGGLWGNPTSPYNAGSDFNPDFLN